MDIRNARWDDIPALVRLDRHISRQELENSVRLGRVYIAEGQGEFAGWLRYNLFWDNTPFMNMLYLLEEYRGHGYGTQLVRYWEAEMAGMFSFRTGHSPDSNWNKYFTTRLSCKPLASTGDE